MGEEWKVEKWKKYFHTTNLQSLGWKALDKVNGEWLAVNMTSKDMEFKQCLKIEGEDGNPDMETTHYSGT